MWVVWITGVRDGGKVHVCETTRVVTEFRHLNGVPGAPGDSLLLIGNEYRIPIPRQRVSLLAGYLRVWPMLVGGALGILAYAMDTWSERLVWGGLSAVAFALFGAGFYVGRLSPAELLQRRAYRAVTGWPADPALLVYGNPSLPEHLRVDLGVRAERIAPDGYRDGHDDWASVATKASAADPSFLAMALTLARIERPEVHDAIWARLAPRIDEVPTSIQPLVNTQGAAIEQPVEAAPPPNAIAPPEVLAHKRGTSLDHGFDVQLPANAYVTPETCASCLAPAEVTRPSSTDKTHRIEIPYCRACRAHASRQESRWTTLQPLTVIVASLACVVGLLPGMTFGAPVATAAALAALIAIAVPLAFPSRRAVAPAHVARDAARLVRAGRESMTVFCLSEEWAKLIASRFAGTVMPRRRVPRGLLPMAPFAMAFAATGAAVAFDQANPEIRIDNGTGAPVAIWVDGARVAAIEPSDERILPEVRVPHGKHTIGWGPVSASTPTSTTEARIEIGGRHLYDPGARHCYYVQVGVYGKVNQPIDPGGPLPIREFHTLARIDHWFTANPHQISSKQGGEVRYAIQRGPICNEALQCSLEARNAFWKCIADADGDDDAGACREALRATCPEAK